MTGIIPRLALLVAIIIFLPIKISYGGTTGKLAGIVLDAETNESLPATVSIENTTIGAISDSEGRFTILNIPPGSYDIRIHLIGYVTKIITDVRISSDKTTTLDVTLESTVIPESTQVVIAEKDMLRIDNPAPSYVTNKEELEYSTKQNIEQIIASQPGIIIDYSGIHSRGSRGDELVVYLNAIRVSDPLENTGRRNTMLGLTTGILQEFQYDKNPIDAENGNILSGSVNIITREGSLDNTVGQLSYWTDNLDGIISNGDSWNHDRLALSMGGPEFLLADHLLPAIGIDLFRNRLAYYLNVDISKEDGPYALNSYVPAFKQRDYQTHNILGIEISDRQYNDYQFNLKLTYRPINAIKMTLNYNGRRNHYNPLMDWGYRYTPGNSSFIKEKSNLYSLTFNHQLNQSTFYEFVLSRYEREYTELPDDPLNPGHGIYPDQFMLFDQWEDFLDMNDNGRYDAPEPFINVNGDTTAFGLPQYSSGDVLGFGGVWYNSEEFWELMNMGDRFIEMPWDQAQAMFDTIFWDWDGDGYIDNADSEPFVDINGDGRWNAGDILTYDTNGNGLFDTDRARNVDLDEPEAYVDGDNVLGEPFQDINGNGIFEEGIDVFLMSSDPGLNMDLNYNSRYDGPDDPWSPGVPYQDLNNNGLYDPPNGRYDYGEPFVDMNHNGKWDASDGFYDYGYDRFARYHNHSSIVNSLDLKLITQMFRELEFKTGIQLRYNELHMADLQYPMYPYDGEDDGGPYPDRGIFRDFYDQYPYEGGIYTNFKLEFGTLIAMIGGRLDIFRQSDNIDELVDPVLDNKPKIRTRFRFSPRFGFSFPITELAKIYFNYGHYYQLPLYSYMYRQATQSTSAFGIVGNYNLDYKKNISYECGVTYVLSDDYVLDVSGFFKDVFGLINSTRRDYGPFSRHEYENMDYARSRGFEFQLRKLFGHNLSGNLGYTYAFSYGKSSSASSGYFDDFYNRAIPIREYPLQWDVRHQLNLNLALDIPRTQKLNLFGFRVPNDWGVNVNWRYYSGKPFTPDRSYPALRLVAGQDPQTNSLRRPPKSIVDLRFHKDLALAGLDYSIELMITNLFDTQNVEQVYSNTGRPDTGTNIQGQVKEGSDIANNPLNYGPGRNIRLGLALNF